ncbi:MAG: hypothetical protein V5A68_00555 [Candidatus Thermoplasmatota archaeon]
MVDNKKNIFITVFLVLALLSMPCMNAFEIPLTESDKKDLDNSAEEIKNQELKNDFKDLFSESKLDLNEVEDEIEEYLKNGYNPIMETASWKLVKDKLGWVYFTMENVTGIVINGMRISNEFSSKYTILTGWFKSIKNLSADWKQFKLNPSFMNIMSLSKSVGSLIVFTALIIKDINDGDLELINSLKGFQENLTEFSSFLDEEPWKKPILIYGTITGTDFNVTVSCKSDSLVTREFYNLTYVTEDTSKPWWIHECNVTASLDKKEKSKEKTAFSMGKIKMDFDLSDIDKSTDKEDSFLKRIFRSLLQKDFLSLWSLFN